MPFHSTTIFTLAHLLPLSLAHLQQQKHHLNLLSSITISSMRREPTDDSVQLINLLSFSNSNSNSNFHNIVFLFDTTVPSAKMPFHSTTIFTLAHLLPLSLAHLPQQETPFKLAILYNNSIADAHPSFLLEEAILLVVQIKFHEHLEPPLLTWINFNTSMDK